MNKSADEKLFPNQGKQYLEYHIPTLERAGLPKGSYEYGMVSVPGSPSLVYVKPRKGFTQKAIDYLKQYKYFSRMDEKENIIYMEMGKLKYAITDPIRMIAQEIKESGYEWQKGDQDPKIKTMKYKSPFSGKKFHVSPSASIDVEDKDIFKCTNKSCGHMAPYKEVKGPSSTVQCPKCRKPMYNTEDEPVTAGKAKTWREIQADYEKKYGENHHCLKLECIKCGDQMTCRCSKPKTLEKGICPVCSGDIKE